MKAMTAVIKPIKQAQRATRFGGSRGWFVPEGLWGSLLIRN